MLSAWDGSLQIGDQPAEGQSPTTKTRSRLLAKGAVVEEWRRERVGFYVYIVLFSLAGFQKGALKGIEPMFTNTNPMGAFTTAGERRIAREARDPGPAQR